MAGLYSDYARQNILENSERSRMFHWLDEEGDGKYAEGTQRRSGFQSSNYCRSLVVQKGLETKNGI